jgi:hypothetical protein
MIGDIEQVMGLECHVKLIFFGVHLTCLERSQRIDIRCLDSSTLVCCANGFPAFEML